MPRLGSPCHCVKKDKGIKDGVNQFLERCATHSWNIVEATKCVFRPYNGTRRDQPMDKPAFCPSRTTLLPNHRRRLSWTGQDPNKGCQVGSQLHRPCYHTPVLQTSHSKCLHNITSMNSPRLIQSPCLVRFKRPTELQTTTHYSSIFF